MLPPRERRRRIAAVGVVHLVVVNDTASPPDLDAELILAAAANEEVQAERQTDDASLASGVLLPAIG